MVFIFVWSDWSVNFACYGIRHSGNNYGQDMMNVMFCVAPNPMVHNSLQLKTIIMIYMWIAFGLIVNLTKIHMHKVIWFSVIPHYRQMPIFAIYTLYIWTVEVKLTHIPMVSADRILKTTSMHKIELNILWPHAVSKDLSIYRSLQSACNLMQNK